MTLKGFLLLLLIIVIVLGATGGDSSAAAVGEAIGGAAHWVRVAWEAMVGADNPAG